MAVPATLQMLMAYGEAWAAHDPDRILAFFADDCEYEDVTLGEVHRGKPAVRAFIAGWFAAVPDFRIEPRGGSLAATGGGTEWVMSGTHTGDRRGLPTTGRRFAVRGASIIELRDGLIRRNADYWDMAAFLRQVGLMAAV